MRLMVLGGNGLGERGAANYRGTCRMPPQHVDQLAEDSEYNRLFAWYMEAGGEWAIVSDLVKARRITVLLQDVLHLPEFELIEVTKPTEEPQIGSVLLGFDGKRRLFLGLLDKTGLVSNESMEFSLYSASGAGRVRLEAPGERSAQLQMFGAPPERLLFTFPSSGGDKKGVLISVTDEDGVNHRIK